MTTPLLAALLAAGAFVKLDTANLERARAKPFGEPALTKAVEAAAEGWRVALAGDARRAAALYDADAVLVTDARRPPVRGAGAIVAALAERARRWGDPKEAVARLRVPIEDRAAWEVIELATASGLRPVVASLWVQRPGGWRKLVEVSAETPRGGAGLDAPGTAADADALDAQRRRWKKLVDAKDPDALAATYAPAARYFRNWDASHRMFEGRDGVAEEYGTYLYPPTYALTVEPLLVAVPSAGVALELGTFLSTNTGFAMRGIYLWTLTRDKPGAPWRIVFDTDDGTRIAPEDL